MYDSFFTSLFMCKKKFIIIGDLNLKKIIRKKWFKKKIHSELKSKKDVLKNGNIYYMTDEKKGFL